jgi:hypothetical protein
VGKEEFGEWDFAYWPIRGTSVQSSVWLAQHQIFNFSPSASIASLQTSTLPIRQRMTGEAHEPSKSIGRNESSVAPSEKEPDTFRFGKALDAP